MIMIQESPNKMSLKFDASKDTNILSSRFKKELEKLDPIPFNEVANQINTWLKGTNTNPMFEYKSRVSTGSPLKHLSVFGVQVRHRHPPIHAVVFVETKPVIVSPKQKNQPQPEPGKIYRWLKLWDDYDKYKDSISSGNARDIAISYFNSGGV